jgi:hypothetical protein
VVQRHHRPSPNLVGLENSLNHAVLPSSRTCDQTHFDPCERNGTRLRLRKSMPYAIVFSSMRVLGLAALAVVGSLFCVVSAGADRQRTGTCAATKVEYRPAPSGAPKGVGGPWVASTNSAFRGYLFYVGATRWAKTKPHGARIFTAKARERVYPKVLWLALGKSRTSISIQGTRLDHAGSFKATYPGVGGGQYPSYIEIPTAGCWRVSVSSGRLRGAVTFVASDTS